MGLPKVPEILDTCHTMAKGYFEEIEYPHEILPKIKDAVTELGRKLDSTYTEISPQVWVANDANVHESAVIMPPAIIGHGTEVRPGAYIRGAVLIGDGCVIGNSTEIKNAIVFDGAQLPHYNYVGDSVIGYRAHMGAGSIASNVRLDKTSAKIKYDDGILDTGLRKMGVILGDCCEVGCNSVLCPGSVIGRGATVYPLTTVTRYIPAGVTAMQDGIRKGG